MLEGLFGEFHSTTSAALGSVQMSPSNHVVHDWSASSVCADVKMSFLPEKLIKHRGMGK